jgi:4-amino-4-deoxychorismate lyase
VAAQKGYRCEYRPLRPADLLTAQGIWLISSITLAARVHTLDGRQLPVAPLAGELTELVDLAVVSDR